METLKPCPFCGGEAELKDDTLIMPVYDENGAYIDAEIVGGGNIWIECQDCGAQSNPFFEEEKSIEAWNRRAYEQTD